MLTLINQSLNWYDFCQLEVDGHMVRGGGGDRMKSGCVILLLLQDRGVLLGSPVLPGAPACWCDACSGAQGVLMLWAQQPSMRLIRVE